FLSTVLATRSQFHYSAMAAAMTPDRPGVVALTAALQPLLVARGITEPQAQERAIVGIIASATSQNALALAFNDVFLMLTAFSAVACLLAVFLHDPVLDTQAPAAAPRPARAPAGYPRGPLAPSSAAAAPSSRGK